MLPSLDRPKTLVDEQGNDLPTLQQSSSRQGPPSKAENGWAQALMSCAAVAVLSLSPIACDNV